MSDTTRDWFDGNFPGVFDNLLYPSQTDDATSVRSVNTSGTRKKRSKPEDIVVTAACRKWWFYSRDLVPPANGVDFIGDQELFEDHLIPFYMLPIVKKANRRKYNSHQWFFDSVCLALGNSCNFALLTDCGTTFNQSCLAVLFKEICLHPELIGVTARQRMEWPNKYFHPCQEFEFEWLRGDHGKGKDKTKKACPRCYLAFLLGPAPLQGFEYEAQLVTALSVYNLVQALPVMPGPCQLLNWQKMRHFQVVKEYFALLFKGEINKKEVIRVPNHYHKMIDEPHEDESDDEGQQFEESDDEEEEEGEGLGEEQQGNVPGDIEAQFMAPQRIPEPQMIIATDPYGRQIVDQFGNPVWVPNPNYNPHNPAGK